ncbi:hypothetical protein F5Y10DRAFT_244258 [Nemania abortiva]|nr:hypothetical protein F5Y10DRAFT_244258 [Nemania abortiva]
MGRGPFNLIGEVALVSSQVDMYPDSAVGFTQRPRPLVIMGNIGICSVAGTTDLEFSHVNFSHGFRFISLSPSFPRVFGTVGSTGGLACGLILLYTVPQIHRRCVDVPVYTVAMPRPHKPPLFTQLFHRKKNNRIVINLLTFRNASVLRTTLRVISTSMASSRTTAMQDYLPGDPVMALDLGASISSQWWLDNYANQQELYDFEPILRPLTQEFSGDALQPTIPQENYLLPPNLPRTEDRPKRSFNSISGSDEEDNHHRAKLRKRDDTSRIASERNSHTTHDSLILGTPVLSTPDTRKSVVKSMSAPKPKLFACPFSKWAKKEHQTVKGWNCGHSKGSGWEIHRLKEHLYRKHSSPKYQCPRCFDEFKDNSRLREHQRSVIPCPVQTKNNLGVKSINPEQMIRLKKRSRRLSDEEKWYEMYRIIFDVDPTADLPSPYYEKITPSIDPDSISDSDLLLCCQLLSCVQDLLPEGLEAQQSPSATIQECIDIVQDVRRKRSDSSPQSIDSHTPDEPGTWDSAPENDFDIFGIFGPEA